MKEGSKRCVPTFACLSYLLAPFTICWANRYASTKLLLSAIPLYAMSNAVPWSTDVGV